MSVGVDTPPRPPVVADDGGKDRGWRELVRVANDIEAHLVAGALRQEGIEPRIVKDRSAPGAWLYGGSNPWAPSVILVRAYDLDPARLVLAEISFDAPSSYVEPSQHSRRASAIRWWLAALSLGALLTAIALARTADELHARCRLPLICAQTPRP